MDTLNTPVLFFVNLALAIIIISVTFGLSALTLIGVIAAPTMLIILVTLTFPKETAD
ncbi:MAG: hypothetical protein ACJAXQ_000069 [Parvibaculaceae bacterium]|jgi:hypothetical protein|nr:hypothetical protein [Parvibaculaceae bacterium]